MLLPALSHSNIYRNKVHLSSNKLKNFFHLPGRPTKRWKIALLKKKNTKSVKIWRRKTCRKKIYNARNLVRKISA